MNRPSRRSLVKGASLLALGALYAPVLPLAARAADAFFLPPTGPMRFTRRLERQLGASQRLIVLREFAIRFVTLSGGGFAVEGGQTACTVDAPAHLASIAALEQGRVDDSLFPAQLDEAGTIRALPYAAAPRELGQAVDEALRQISASDLPRSTRAEAGDFLRALAQLPGDIGQTPPADLYIPPANAMEASRTIDLGDGTKGQIEVSFAGTREGTHGPMRSAGRTITTRFGDTLRISRESWTLDPA
jgi:hypothetical protein